MRGFTRISNGATLPSLGVCAVVAVAGIAAGSSLDFSPAPAAVSSSSSTIDEISRADTPNHGVSSYAEHRYRIIGKLRMAVIWAKHDDIGSARMTWRSDADSSALALMVGSDPQRAPRSLNKWGYLREEIRSDRAEVFTVRSLGGSEASSATDYAASEGPLFGASCSSIGNTDVTGAKTTVSAAGVTYRMFDRLLDRIAVAPRWQEKRTTRPEGADAGFLTALQHVIRAGRNDSTSAKAAPITYIYNSTIYDLTIQGSRQLGRTTVGSRTFDQLTRTDVSVRNRATEEVSKFAVTYSPDRTGTPLPVQIFCQPNFWLSVELRLDDTADVPADPASDLTALARIRAICDTAIR
jgi:hypothetical protein